MKRISFFRRGAGLALLAATLAALHPLPTPAQSTHPASPDTLTVMTYN